MQISYYYNTDKEPGILSHDVISYSVVEEHGGPISHPNWVQESMLSPAKSQ